MNIFFLSFIPSVCAQMHGDLHLIKMILETAQLLSTTYRWLHGQRPKLKTIKLREKLEASDPVTFYDDSWIEKCTHECGKEPYRMTHYNHGSCVWVRERQANFVWLAQLGVELCREKIIRLPNNKPHCAQPLLEWFLTNPPAPELFKINEVKYLSPPYLAMADFWDSKVVHNNPFQAVILSYRKYYKAKQAINIVYYRWLPGREPQWLKDHPNIDSKRIEIIKQKLNK